MSGSKITHRCAFLTMADRTGYVIDDELVLEPLRARGWDVDTLPWQQDGVAWGDYDLVVIRSTWDYYGAPDAFLAVLGEIERSGTRLLNPLELVRWNLEKTYLRDLAARGVPVVPTLFRDRLRPGEIEGIFYEVNSEGDSVPSGGFQGGKHVDIVLKPVIGASGIGAFRLRRERKNLPEVEAYFADRALMAQPFLRAVVEEGEHSLFYFDGEYSHAIMKTPAAGEFRSQEEHGANIVPVTADEALRAAGQRALQALPVTPLYARIDLVHANDGDALWIMELELIEPSMYLRADPAAPERFARAIAER